MSEESTAGLALGQVAWSRLIGKRLLVREREGDNCFDYTVRETSPSGLRVKFENAAGRTFWTDNLQYIPVEILP